MSKIGLFFGTFDPIHIGHLQLANYFAEETDLDSVWLVITPQNPFKKDLKILANSERMQIISRAIKNCPKLKVSSVEFKLPKPNYTFNTLIELKKKYLEHTFVIVLGADNMIHFDKWKASDKILENFELYIYPRKIIKAIPNLFLKHPKIKWADAPIIEISSSQIRKGIREAKDMSIFIPKESWEYIEQKKFYR